MISIDLMAKFEISMKSSSSFYGNFFMIFVCCDCYVNLSNKIHKFEKDGKNKKE